MSNRGNHNCAAVAAVSDRRKETAAASNVWRSETVATDNVVRHIYVHIPFCARICPYCAFYKALPDRSQSWRFCEAIVRELEQYQGGVISRSPERLESRRSLAPTTIYFGGGTPTALTIGQLELLLEGFHEHLDLSQLAEWTIEANPGSVSARKAAVLKRFGVNRVSLGVQSWDNQLLKLLGRDHNTRQAEQSFHLLRAAGFLNINLDLMFGLPAQTNQQWRLTLERTIALQPDHISAYCLTYEEDTDFFLRHARGEFRQDPDADAEFFEIAMSVLENAGYEHYEISNYAHAGFKSAHNRAYWFGEDYLGVGPSAVSTIGMQRWQNICDYRAYIDQVLSAQSPVASIENLTTEMKRMERIALALRTRDGVSVSELNGFAEQTNEFVALGLLQRCDGNFVLTRKGKAVADSVVEAFV